MKIFKIVCFFAVVCCFIGCASSARMEAMVPANDSSSQTKFDPGLTNSLIVQNVAGGQETNPMWTSQISDSDFRAALAKALENASLLANSGNSKYDLKAVILSLDQPMFGLNFTVTTTVSYFLMDHATGKELYNKTIVAPYTATFGDAFSGVVRLRLANEGSGRENIRLFLVELARLKISDGNISVKN